MRKMVTIREISSISPIENADKIEVATVSGWKVVVSKGKHHPGEKVAYFEIDTLLPEDNPLFDEFTQRSTKKSVNPQGDTVKGHVLRTIKLRGQVSQGLIMPLDKIGLSPQSTQDEVDAWMEDNGVFKHEPPIISLSGGDLIGVFPEKYARKTESERVQNLDDDFLSSLNKNDWYATEKIDGTSSTFFVDEEGRFRAASRNYEVSLDNDSPYAVASRVFHLEEMMCPGQLIQAEIYGEGIQGNKLKAKGINMAVFHTEGIGVDDGDIYAFVQSKSVPKLSYELPSTVEEAVEQVNGMRSLINPDVLAEGVVWWNKNGESFTECGDRPNFKAINNKFLLKEK